MNRSVGDDEGDEPEGQQKSQGDNQEGSDDAKTVVKLLVSWKGFPFFPGPFRGAELVWPVGHKYSSFEILLGFSISYQLPWGCAIGASAILAGVIVRASNIGNTIIRRREPLSWPVFFADPLYRETLCFLFLCVP